MAGTSSKTTAIGVRVPNDTLAVWQAEVGEGSISAYILARAMRPDLSGEIAALQSEVARLKRELAQRQPAVERAADPTSEKAVAAILPVTGDRFPKQLTWWQKQQLAAEKKGKAK